MAAKKRCGTCKVNYNIELFPIDRREKDGRRYQCRMCSSSARRYKKYSLDNADMQAILNDQQGMCAICKTFDFIGRGPPCIDHSHTTGKNRGVLCRNCNTALGYMHDSPEVVSAALDYLRKYE